LPVRRSSSTQLGRGVAGAFRALKALRSTEAGIAFDVNPRLVRGLDYYNRTVFEWVDPMRWARKARWPAAAATDGLCRAARRQAHACVRLRAFGIERMILLMREQGAPSVAVPDAYIVHTSRRSGRAAGRVASRSSCATRAARSRCTPAAAGFKSQMKRADASGAPYARDHRATRRAARDSVAIKPLRGGDQFTVAAAEIAARFRRATALIRGKRCPHIRIFRNRNRSTI
jgi:histidyl-tRNA synthetase